jgi:MFS family permease
MESKEAAITEDEVQNSGASKTSDNDFSAKDAADSNGSSAITDWPNDPANPLKWPAWKKGVQLAMLCSASLVTSIATSILSPSIFEIMAEFDVSRTLAILTVSLYVLALGFGPVIGGPLSETIGRHPVYMASLPLGGLFTLGTGFTNSFAAVCVLRFLAGMCWGPILAVAPATIQETFPLETRGPPSALFILTPFLGPGLGPVIGAFVTTRKGWRWNMWTLLFFTAASMVITSFSSETFGPKIRKQLAKKRQEPLPSKSSWSEQLNQFMVVAIIRPLHMLFFEPIVGFFCLYIAFGFGILFGFFAIVPYVFTTVYHFSIENCGLVFLSVAIGCFLGLVCILLCDVFFYRKQIPKHPIGGVPPEYRLYPAMFGSIGLPIGLFWFAWSAREEVSWASPAAAIIPFACGNLCIFVGAVQYLTDSYHGNVIASGASSTSLARYSFAAAFPLFIIQMYEDLTIKWAGSLFGFCSLLLLPIPWIIFKYGPLLRSRSKYKDIQ